MDAPDLHVKLDVKLNRRIPYTTLFKGVGKGGGGLARIQKFVGTKKQRKEEASY